MLSDGTRLIADGEQCFPAIGIDGSQSEVPSQSLAKQALRRDVTKRAANLLAINAPIACQKRTIFSSSYCLGVWLGVGTLHTGAIQLPPDDIDFFRNRFLDEGESLTPTPSRFRQGKQTFVVSPGHYVSLPRDAIAEVEFLIRFGVPVDEIASSTQVEIGKIQTIRDRIGSLITTSEEIAAEAFKERLRRFGILHRRKIPREFLRSDYSQRVSLLQGLLDTRGKVDGNRQWTVRTESKALAFCLAELVRTLGVYVESPMFMFANYARNARWEVRFTLPNTIQPCTLPRILEQHNSAEHPKEIRQAKSVISVEPATTFKVKGIRVDSPSRCFLIGSHFTPTLSVSV